MGKVVNRSLSYIIQIVVYCLILAKSDDIMIWAVVKHSGIFAWQSSCWIDLTMLLYALLVLYALWHLLMQKYYVNLSFWLFGGFISLFWWKVCHDSPSYDFTSLKYFASLSWADVMISGLWLLLGSYLVKQIGILFRHKFVSQKKKSGNKEEARGLLYDDPIKSKKDDKLGYSKWAEIVSKEIRNLKKEKAYSYGIVGEWGTGKSSFINLIREELQRSGDEIEIIDFNPRNSSNSGYIQEDFLLTLCEALKKYDMELSLLASRYIKSLRLDSRINILASFLNLFPSSNVQELRQRIGESIMRINHTIVVFIDDLDRMGREEIIEVFKLINCNASFPNTVFVIAYDKAQINSILPSTQEQGGAKYAEKYFNRELRLVVPPGKIHVFFGELVSQNINLKQFIREEETTCLQSVIDQNFTNVRDLKKFVNQLVEIEEWRWDEVVKTEMILLQIIRYKYNDEYTALRNRMGLSEELTQGQVRKYYIKDIEKKQPEGLRIIIQNLLSKDGIYTYKTMKTACSYYNYFIDVSELLLKWSEMENLFTLNTPFKDVEDCIRNNLIRKEEQLRAITVYHLWKDKNALLELKGDAFSLPFYRDIQILFCCSCVFSRDAYLKQLYDGLLEEELCHDLLSTSQKCAFEAVANYPSFFAVEAKEYLKRYDLQNKMRKLEDELKRQQIGI